MSSEDKNQPEFARVTKEGLTPDPKPPAAAADQNPKPNHGGGHSRKRQKDLKNSFLVTLFIFVIGAAAITHSHINDDVEFPEIYISSFDVSSFNLTVQHPSSNKTAISYGEIQAAVLYSEHALADTSLPPFDHKFAGDVTHLRAEFPVLDGIRGDGSFGVRVLLRARITKRRLLPPPFFGRKIYYLRAHCRDIGVSFENHYSVRCEVNSV